MNLFLSYDEAMAMNKAASGYMNFNVDKDFVMLIWDNYRLPEGMDRKDALLYFLGKQFPYTSAKRLRPFGEFKDKLGKTEVEIYDEFIKTISTPRFDKNYEEVSYFEAMWAYIKKRGYDRYYGGVKLLKKNFAIGMSMLLAGTVPGIVLEAKVHKALERVASNSSRLVYTPAPVSMENQDVDGVFRYRRSGQIALKVSIKNLEALSPESINRFRTSRKNRGKGKTKPDVYIGYKTRKAEKLTFFSPNGDSLTETIKKALNREREMYAN